MPKFKQIKAALKRHITDIAFLGLLILFWIVYISPVVIGEKRHGYDIFRDAGTAVNMQNGQYFADPVYAGESLWYPPLSPMIAACVSKVTGITPLDYYRLSQLFFNWLIPAGFFLLMRLKWGLRAAILGTVALLFAMPWWQAEVHQGQPSIHAIVLGWAALLLYAYQHKRQSNLWALVCGVFQGICFWHHPFVPTLLASGFVLQTMWWYIQQRHKTELSGEIKRKILIIGVTLLTAFPILYQLLRGPVLNHVGREYIAGEMHSIRFALMHGNPWLWATGIAGIVYCIRKADFGERLLVSLLAISLLGQIPGYLRLYGGEWASKIPVLVPHEFQRLFQLGWAAAIGVGMDSILCFLTERIKFFKVHPSSIKALTLAVCVITGGWGLVKAKNNYREYVHTFPNNPVLKEAGKWIMENTDINDVFACEPQLAFCWLNAETGRKVLLVPAGHSNPRVNWQQRATVLVEMGNAPNGKAFQQLAHKNGIKYFIPSRGWIPCIIGDSNIYNKATATCIEPVYSGYEGLTIYKIVESPTKP